MPAELSLLETRVLGVLMEKERTVPDTYPMTLNSLVAGCNQKTSRAPIVSTTETDVRSAIDSLKSLNLVIESSGGRVSRYTHNFERVLQVPRQASAVLAVLMLRGSQTAGELRMNSERLHPFSDISSVEGFLNELRDRSAGALVTELPRQPGSRENRWAHLLSGAVAIPEVPPSAELASAATPSMSELARLKEDVARMQAELDELKSAVAGMTAELRLR